MWCDVEMKSKFTSGETRLSAYNEPKIGQVENAIACKSRRADQPHLAKGLGPGTPSAPLTSFDLWQHKQTLCQWSAVKRLLKCKTLDASPAGCKSLAAFRPTDSLRGSRRATRSTPDALPSCQINCKQIERVLVDFQNCIAYALTSHITGCVSAAIAC